MLESKFAAKIIVCCQLSNLLHELNKVHFVFFFFDVLEIFSLNKAFIELSEGVITPSSICIILQYYTQPHPIIVI